MGHLSIPAVPMPTCNDTWELKEELKDSSMLRELGGTQMKPPPTVIDCFGQCPTKVVRGGEVGTAGIDWRIKRDQPGCGLSLFDP